MTGAMPVPESAIVVEEFVALLATMTLPVALPAVAGANVALRVVVWPGVRITPDAPLALKPAPETLTFEMVMFELPALVRVTFWLLLLPIVTLPKFMAAEDALRIRVVAPTVRVAGELVTLPVLLLTATVNCALLSAVISAGVV